MNRLKLQIDKARHSAFRLWLLNQGLLRVVPFNRPHGLKLVYIGEEELTIRARNSRVNQNHIKGIHACLLATLCEYVTGLSLLRHLDPEAYRIILKGIDMQYHYQAKMDVNATCKLDQHTLKTEVLVPLQEMGVILKTFQIAVRDTDDNHICTGTIQWQVKSWDKVRLKV